jgi:flagellar assembly factor FliW
MSDNKKPNSEIIKVVSSRFGDFDIEKELLIEFPEGMIGFPAEKFFVVLDHKPPFSWLHAAYNKHLAFVVVDGGRFGEEYDVKPPYGDPSCDLKQGDEYAVLIVVTVRSDPRLTTANLKAPIFVNLRNRKAVQIILDDSRFSTRHPLWNDSEKEEAKSSADSENAKNKK